MSTSSSSKSSKNPPKNVTKFVSPKKRKLMAEDTGLRLAITDHGEAISTRPTLEAKSETARQAYKVLVLKEDDDPVPAFLIVTGQNREYTKRFTGSKMTKKIKTLILKGIVTTTITSSGSLIMIITKDPDCELEITQGADYKVSDDDKVKFDESLSKVEIDSLTTG